MIATKERVVGFNQIPKIVMMLKFEFRNRAQKKKFITAQFIRIASRL